MGDAGSRRLLRWFRGRSGRLGGGPRSPRQAPDPALGRGQRHEATPSHGNGPAHTKHPRLILVPRSYDCRLGPKRKRVGRAGRGESISRPQESGLGGPCPRLPAPQTPPCFRGRSPCLIPQPQIIPLSPPEHHAAQPRSVAPDPPATGFPPALPSQTSAKHCQKSKNKMPPPIFEHKTAFFTGMLRGGSHPAPPGGHRPARRCAQRGAQPPHAPRAPSPRPCPGPELSHGWLRAEASHRGPSPPLAVRLPGE